MATPTRSIVLPALPPIDKYIAVRRVELDWRGIPMKFEIEFCGRNIPRREDYQRWDRGNPGSAIVIDLGDAKYHHGYQSASEMAKLMSHTDGGAVWNRLQELANQNNRSGFLKQRRHSVAKLIREFYHLGSGWPDLKWHRICWTNCMDVVDSFFWRMDGRNWDTLFTDPTYAELKRIWNGFDVQEKEVLEFTLPLYFRKLFRSGRHQVPQIIQKMSWWLDNQKRVEARHDQARRKQYQFKPFHIHGHPAGLVRINDYFEGSAFSYNHLGAAHGLVLGIIRNPRGGAVIQCSFRHEFDLEQLYQALNRREPNRWYYEPRFSSGPMIMNQSWQFYEEQPTSLTDDELIRMTYTLAKYLGPKGGGTRTTIADVVTAAAMGTTDPKTAARQIASAGRSKGR